MKKLIPLALLLALLLTLTGCSTKEERQQYKNGLALYESGKYQSALTAFEAADGYKKSEKYIKLCQYYTAMLTVSPDSDPEQGYSGSVSCTADNATLFAQAVETLRALDGYKSSDRILQDAEKALEAYNTRTRMERLVTTIEKALVGYVDRCEYDGTNFFVYFDEKYPITLEVVTRGRSESAVRESWCTVRSWFTDAVFEYIPGCTVYLVDCNDQMLGGYTYNSDSGELNVVVDMATKPY